MTFGGRARLEAKFRAITAQRLETLSNAMLVFEGDPTAADTLEVILRELHELVGGDVISDGAVERFFVAGRQLVGSSEPQALEVSFGTAGPSITFAGSASSVCSA